MSNISELINKVIDKKIDIEKQVISKMQVEKEEREILLTKIKSFKEDITELIELANVCTKQGFKISKNDDETKNFIAESIFHKIGFCNNQEYPRNNPFTYIGINGGGVCGEWHFRTNGVDTIEFKQSGSDYFIRRDVQLKHLRKFVNEFTEFRENFIKYVEELCK